MGAKEGPTEPPDLRQLLLLSGDIEQNPGPNGKGHDGKVKQNQEKVCQDNIVNIIAN